MVIYYHKELIKMLKRKILKDLLYWKNNHRNNCLMVIGARQVGKTYIIKKFAEENYENFAYYSCFACRFYRYNADKSRIL